MMHMHIGIMISGPSSLGAEILHVGSHPLLQEAFPFISNDGLERESGNR
jgi:hypothetical protein